MGENTGGGFLELAGWQQRSKVAAGPVRPPSLFLLTIYIFIIKNY
ncbi:hypothetical protein [Nitrososphaera viennensis]|uniref:Uncharacterized protein n=1 Tax=Nitrososphaera viennensis TaxID=1034015 RepID=A0A977NL09_9ARCH|nr:hypothetical protein [Nitrososphaera viennensis]UVS68299.1 hypothetical protein NWT39_10360 [Nitrososphaera viennensis]